MNVRSIVLSTAALACAASTPYAAGAAAATHVVASATPTPKPNTARKMKSAMRPKPRIVKAIAPSHPGPQGAAAASTPPR